MADSADKDPLAAKVGVDFDESSLGGADTVSGLADPLAARGSAGVGLAGGRLVSSDAVLAFFEFCDAVTVAAFCATLPAFLLPIGPIDREFPNDNRGVQESAVE